MVRTAAGDRLDEPAGPESIPDVSVMASGNLGLITFPRVPGRAHARADRGASGPG